MPIRSTRIPAAKRADPAITRSNNRSPDLPTSLVDIKRTDFGSLGDDPSNVLAVEVEGIDQMNKPPRIEAVEVVGPMLLRITWSTGEHFDLDLSGPIMRLEALAPLRDPAFFAGAQIGEWGHSLVWNDEVDLGADRLYERCKEQAGELSPSKFDAWMKNHQLSLTSAADALGLSRRMIAHYRTGSRPIPKIVSLACKGWEVQTNNPAHVQTNG